MDGLTKTTNNSITCQDHNIPSQPTLTHSSALNLEAKSRDGEGAGVLRALSERDTKKLASPSKVDENVEILGQLFPVIILPDNTPILFQWFSLNEDAKIPDSYYKNLKRACELETGRQVGLLISGHRISTYDKKKFSELLKNFKNFQLIDFDLINVEEFNFHLSKVSIEAYYTKNPSSREHDYKHLYNKLEMGLDDFRVLNVLEQHQFFQYFDAARHFSMLLAGDLFKTGDNSPSGCIYLDLDMAIASQLGAIKTADGFSCYFNRCGSSLFENSLFAVDRSRHPVLMKALEEMKKDCIDTPAPRVFKCYKAAIYQHFFPEGPLTEKDREKFSSINAIAFPTNNIDADQSEQSQESSWSYDQVF